MMIVLLVAFIVNIVLVLLRKLTKVRTVFITGHIMVQQSSTALWILLFCFPHLQDLSIVIMLGILLGTYWAVSSNLTVECCQERRRQKNTKSETEEMTLLNFVSPEPFKFI